jgi:hypothetical protein
MSQPIGATKTTHVKDMSNAEFLERYGKAGAVGLAGGPSALDTLIRKSQRRQTTDGAPSEWGHAFLFQGRRPDGHHWVLESDLDVHRERVQLGVQENRISKYHDEDYFQWLAILDFGVTDAQVNRMVAVGLDLVNDRVQYSLREVFATYWKLRKPALRGKKNPLSRDRAMFCSAFVQHLYLAIGIDFADAVDTKLTTPEDIAQTPVPHLRYVLHR